MKQESGPRSFSGRKTVIWTLLATGFAATEFPGILFVGGRISPRILGLPFLYGYLLCCWIYFCLVLIYACRTKWGKAPFFKKDHLNSD